MYAYGQVHEAIKGYKNAAITLFSRRGYTTLPYLNHAIIVFHVRMFIFYKNRLILIKFGTFLNTFVTNAVNVFNSPE